MKLQFDVVCFLCFTGLFFINAFIADV